MFFLININYWLLLLFLTANKSKVFFGLLHDPELLAALADDGDSDEDKDEVAMDNKEKPKVWFLFILWQE